MTNRADADYINHTDAGVCRLQLNYPNTPTFKREVEEWRGFLGRYGVTGKMQTTRIGELSEGQKSRIVFAMLCMSRPNMVRTCCIP